MWMQVDNDDLAVFEAKNTGKMLEETLFWWNIWWDGLLVIASKNQWKYKSYQNR